MEWLILLLLVPGIVVPVVLLCGFAGCKFEPRPASPASPTLTATAKNVDHISVSWQNNATDTVLRYHFIRKKGGVTETDTEVDVSITSVEDTGLTAHTDYTYEVSAITASDVSAAASFTVTTFQTAFDAAAEAPNDQAAPLGDFCFVQRIAAADLLADGGKVGLKLRGTPAANATIHRIFISRVASTGNLYDSAGDLTQVRGTDLTLANDQPIDLDPVDYGLDQTQDLLIAFDFTVTSAAGHIAFVLHPGAKLFFKPGVQQASASIRDPDYTPTVPGDPRLYFVVTIGVP